MNATSTENQLSTLENLILEIAKLKRHPMDARMLRASSRAIKEHPVEATRAAIVRLVELGYGTLSGEGTLTFFTINGGSDFLPMAITKDALGGLQSDDLAPLECLGWQLQPEDRIALIREARATAPATTDKGVFYSGSWVKRAEDPKNVRPYQVVSIDQETATAKVSLHQIQNFVDFIKVKDLDYADAPNDRDFGSYPKPSPNALKLHSPQTKTAPKTLETELFETEADLATAKKEFAQCQKDLFDAKVSLKNFEQSPAPNQNELNVAQFLQIKENFEHQVNCFKAGIEGCEDRLSKSQSNLERFTKKVSDLKNEIERQKQIKESVREYQKHYAGLVAELQKLNTLKALSAVSFSINGASIPYFDKKGDMRLKLVTDILRENANI